jgi:hypothetical protein
MTDRKEHARNLARKISKMTDDERRRLAAGLLVRTIEGRILSPVNQLLIAGQGAAGATIVGGFRQWLKAGRVVKKGEKSLAIWCPTTRKARNPKTGAEEPDETGFILGSVFDVSQTVELEQPATAVA